VRKERILIGIIIVLSAIILVGALWGYKMLGNGTVAVIQGEKISESEFIDQLKSLYGKEVLNEIINKKVIYMAAEKYGIKASQEEINREYNELREGYETEEDFHSFLKEQMGWTKEQLLDYIEYYILWEEIATKDVHISDEQILQYYEDNQALFTEPEKFHLHQIIVNTEEEAEQVMKELNNGSDFNTLAKERSIDILTANNGGDLGLVAISDPSIDPNIISTAVTLKMNEVAMTQTEEGYAVIQVTEHYDAVQYALEDVKDQIRREIALSQVNSLPEALEQLKMDFDVEILDPALRE